MVPDNTLTDFRNQSESHDGPELNLYTAGANTGAWAFVVTKTDTKLTLTPTQTHSSDDVMSSPRSYSPHFSLKFILLREDSAM
jgi:hypothetical protein